MIGDYSLHDHPMMTVAIHKAIREEAFCSSTYILFNADFDVVLLLLDV